MDRSGHLLKMPRTSGDGDLSHCDYELKTGSQKQVQRPHSILWNPHNTNPVFAYFSCILLTLEAVYGSSLSHPLLEESFYKKGTIPQCLAPVLTSPVRAPTAEKLKETLLVPSSVSGIQCSACLHETINVSAVNSTFQY